MSAHRIYCYAPQRIAVESFLRDLGSIISHDVPHAVHTAEELRGLDHITFIMIDNHPSPVPPPMWDAVIADGAIVIHVDDQYKRDRIERVHVRHYEPVQTENPITSAHQRAVVWAFIVIGAIGAVWGALS